jgi:hypothetical protein
MKNDTEKGWEGEEEGAWSRQIGFQYGNELKIESTSELYQYSEM